MSNTPTVQVWDIWVRLFHWSLVISVLFLLFSGETGIGFFDWHRGAGEFVLLLLTFRLLWGIFGSTNARLLSLFRHPIHALNHIKSLIAGKSHPERGHNAAGGWAVLALLSLLSVQALTGLFIADEDELTEGAFYGLLSTVNTDLLYSIHHINAELLMVLIAVHVVMVFFYLVRAGQNLISPMVTGRMKRGEAELSEIRFGAWWLGLLFLLAACLVVGWLLGWGLIF